MSHQNVHATKKTTKQERMRARAKQVEIELARLDNDLQDSQKKIHRTDSIVTLGDLEEIPTPTIEELRVKINDAMKTTLDYPVPEVKSEGSDDPLRKSILRRNRTILEDEKLKDFWDSNEIIPGFNDDLLEPLEPLEAEKEVEEETKAEAEADGPEFDGRTTE